jgi:hypothetical protein
LLDDHPAVQRVLQLPRGLRGRRPATVVTAASDAIARAAHDLEIALGEGPAVTAMTAGVPVSAVGGSLPDRWPLYGPAIGELGVRAVVAVPLRNAAGCPGTLCVYSPEPVLPDGAVAAAGRVADAVTYTMLLPPPDQPRTEASATSRCSVRATTRQSSIRRRAWSRCRSGAQSMTQNACSARAFADGRPAEEVALSVLRRETRLN